MFLPLKKKSGIEQIANVLNSLSSKRDAEGSYWCEKDKTEMKMRQGELEFRREELDFKKKQEEAKLEIQKNTSEPSIIQTKATTLRDNMQFCQNQINDTSDEGIKKRLQEVYLKALDKLEKLQENL